MEAPRLWLKMVMQTLWNVEEYWKKRKMELTLRQIEEMQRQILDSIPIERKFGADDENNLWKKRKLASGQVLMSARRRRTW